MRTLNVFARATMLQAALDAGHLTRAMLQVWMLQTGALTLLGQNPSQLAK